MNATKLKNVFALAALLFASAMFVACSNEDDSKEDSIDNSLPNNGGTPVDVNRATPLTFEAIDEVTNVEFDEKMMQFTMGNSIVMEDNNANKKLYKNRHDRKIDSVAAMMDAYVAFKANYDMFF